MVPVKHLYEVIQERDSGWRSSHYLCADYHAIGEILEYAVLPESDNLRFLRRPFTTGLPQLAWKSSERRVRLS